MDDELVAEDFHRAKLAARDLEVRSAPSRKGAKSGTAEPPAVDSSLARLLRPPDEASARSSSLRSGESAEVRRLRKDVWAASKQMELKSFLNCQSACSYEVLSPSTTVDPAEVRVGKTSANIYIEHPFADDWNKTAAVEAGDGTTSGPQYSRRIVGFETTFKLPGSNLQNAWSTHHVRIHSSFEAWYYYILSSSGKASYGEFRTSSLLSVHVGPPLNEYIIDGYSPVLAVECPRGNWKKDITVFATDFDARPGEHEISVAVPAGGYPAPTPIRVQELFLIEAIRHHRADRCTAWASCSVHYEPLAVVTVRTCPTITKQIQELPVSPA